MSLNRLHQLSWIYDLVCLGQEDDEAKDAASIYQHILQHIVSGFEAESGSLALLEVHSDVGKGTTIRVWLPINQPQQDFA
jgi:hypothetical protein